MSTLHRKNSLLMRGLKISHLRLLAGLGDGQALTTAAAEVGISQPAASRLMAEIEGIVGHRIHERSGRGIDMTPIGLAMARRARRVLLELDDAARDLAEIAAGGVGQVRVGAVTGAALDRVLPALESEGLAHPNVHFEVVVAQSDVLCEQVLSGKLDFALGRLPDGPEAEGLSYAALEAEPVALIVRQGHPALTGDMALVLNQDWILPEAGSLLTGAVLTRLSDLGLPRPRMRVATSSIMLTFALLRRSDAVAAVSRPIARLFEGMGLAILPVDLGIEVEPYGMIARRQVSLTPAARRLADLVQLGA